MDSIKKIGWNLLAHLPQAIFDNFNSMHSKACLADAVACFPSNRYLDAGRLSVWAGGRSPALSVAQTRLTKSPRPSRSTAQVDRSQRMPPLAYAAQARNLSLVNVTTVGNGQLRAQGALSAAGFPGLEFDAGVTDIAVTNGRSNSPCVDASQIAR
ncbi:hypothetical protein [Novosphingobium resinovorum]|uniref:hypothetical protein n=1 Tax=Novosphingobium resinovorum TaxID=158500 RepID=UPI002ED1143A|nr:hypothetical protein [Novosphingobium resinovorum]